jgi:hypothetical protein
MVCRWTAGVKICLGILLAILATYSARADVDTALVLSVDVSSSVDQGRYSLQMEGIASALEDESVIGAFLSGPNRSIMVALLTWTDSPRIAISWTKIASAEDARAFAGRVRVVNRHIGVFTCVSRMFQFLPRLLKRLPEPAARVVIDVSGDGSDNCNPGRPAADVREELVSQNVTVNGLPILEGPEASTIEAWYRANVKGGPGAFIFPAISYQEFGTAIRQKIIKEISDVSRKTGGSGGKVAEAAAPLR